MPGEFFRIFQISFLLLLAGVRFAGGGGEVDVRGVQLRMLGELRGIGLLESLLVFPRVDRSGVTGFAIFCPTLLQLGSPSGRRCRRKALPPRVGSEGEPCPQK